jgi:hypothetical protein
MGEPRPGIRRRDGGQRTRDRRVKRLARARLGGTQERLDLGPAPLDRVQVGRVRRQVEQPRPFCRDGLLHACRLVRRQIIRHHDVALTKRGAQHLLHVGPEYVGVGRALDRHDRFQPRVGERPSYRHVLPVVLRGAAQHALTTRRSAIEASHREIDTRLVDELDAAQVECGTQVAVERACGLDARDITR